MAELELPRQVPQQIVAFCKYGETAQQALASITVAINAYMERDAGEIGVETMSHTVTQLNDPIPSLSGIAPDVSAHYVVTALVTFRVSPSDPDPR